MDSSFWIGPKKINVSFLETSQYFLASVGREFFFFWKNFYLRKSMKIVQNTLKIEEKFSDIPKCFRVGSKKIGSVGSLETIHFFFFFWSRVGLRGNKGVVQATGFIRKST